MRHVSFVIAAALLATLAACATVVPEPPPTQRTAVEDSHRCAGACDHIFVEGGWRIVPNHKHAPNCGHYLVDGKWVSEKGDDKVIKPPPDKN